MSSTSPRGGVARSRLPKPDRRPGRLAGYRRSLIILGIGILLFGMGITYLVLPAKDLPVVFPGRNAAVTLHLLPNALVCLVVALFCLFGSALAAPRVPKEQQRIVEHPRLLPRGGMPPPSARR